MFKTDQLDGLDPKQGSATEDDGKPSGSEAKVEANFNQEVSVEEISELMESSYD